MSLRKELKKIVLIGPVYPYKGGISHYTGLMCRALKKKYDVTMVSYKMQYPKLLFKKEQKDFANDTFRIDDAEFLINTANPFNWVKTALYIKKMDPDLVIIQWWHPYFAPCYWTLRKLIRNAQIMFTCHNVFPHERFPMDRFLTKLVLKNGDTFIVQSSIDDADLKTIVEPDIPIKRTVIPTFNAFKLQNLSKKEGRCQLHISEDEKVLLFFGFVREYKGLKWLLKALPAVREALPDVRLLVVGDFGNDKTSYLNMIDKLAIEKYVEIFDGYIPDKEVEKFFASADLVVLPYESATQSGIVQISYGFEKPVIATNVGGLPEVVVDGKTGYVAKSKNSEDLAKQIIRFFKESKADDFKKGIEEEAYKYSWDRMTETVEDLYKIGRTPKREPK